MLANHSLMSLFVWCLIRDAVSVKAIIAFVIKMLYAKCLSKLAFFIFGVLKYRWLEKNSIIINILETKSK